MPLVAEIERAVSAALVEEESILARYGPTTIKILEGIGLAGLSLLRSASLKGKLEGGVGPLAKGSAELGFDGENFVDGLEKAWDRVEKERKDAWQTLVDQSTNLTIFDRLRSVYAELDRSRPGAEKRIPRIAVFIDDLDRCQADKAFELIEAVKLVLGQKGFIFILALDKRIVDAYVEGLWRERLKDRFGQEATRYLDKIVQLPLYLRNHERSFAPFVECLLGKMREGGVPEDTVAVFEGARSHLGRATEFGPRSLVRRINTVLVDQRLRPPAHESDAQEVKDLTPAQFLGLCLVQRTLLDYLEYGAVLSMARNDRFCDELAGVWLAAKHANDVDSPDPVSAMYAHLDTLRNQQPGNIAPNAETKLLERQIGPEAPKHAAWRQFLVKLDPYPACKYMLGTDDGLRWLGSRALRDLVTDFVSLRPAEANVAPAGSPYMGVGLEQIGVTSTAESAELREQVALVERFVRQALGLKVDTDLGPEAWSDVRELILSASKISDVGVAWLARPDSGLDSVYTVDLGGTQVSDAGVAALARPDSGLRALSTLSLYGTRVTDAGLRELARSNTGLKRLSTLDLSRTGVTDVGLNELANPDCGLTGLRWLHLGETATTREMELRVAERFPAIRISRSPR